MSNPVVLSFIVHPPTGRYIPSVGANSTWAAAGDGNRAGPAASATTIIALFRGRRRIMNTSQNPDAGSTWNGQDAQSITLCVLSVPYCVCYRTAAVRLVQEVPPQVPAPAVPPV